MDDLFAPKKQPLSVSQVNQRARLLLERHFGAVAVVGEVSGLRIVSGHSYFCLKDADAALSAVLFRKEAQKSKLELKDGMEVLATGRLTIYGPQGRYQLVIDQIERRGAGALLAAFAELRARLEAEGLFAAEHKRRLPLIPRRVAVVTSPTGAVIRDIVNVATRRFANARILVVPTRVQGEEAAPQIAACIRKVSTLAPRLGVDVMIVARGGGSLEDLWCFNDERVARAIYASIVPVVSAVGHETDFTISDFVADVRAPTPSAAAELVFPLKSDLRALLVQHLARARAAVARDASRRRMHLRALRAELGDPRSLLREQSQALAQALVSQEDAVRRGLMQRRLLLRRLENSLARLHPRTHLGELRARMRGAQARVAQASRQRLLHDRQRLLALEKRLVALSPLGVLERGYAIVLGPQGSAVRDPREVAPGDPLRIRVHGGTLAAAVTESPAAQSDGAGAATNRP